MFGTNYMPILMSQNNGMDSITIIHSDFISQARHENRPAAQMSTII
jgi:hypothetical protein